MHVTAAHDEAQIERALFVLAEVGRSLGLIEEARQASGAKLRRRA
jgi:hypothetical protein